MIVGDFDVWILPLLFSEDGRAYSFGGGGNGQLGHGNKLLDTSSVQLITGLKDLHITSVYCGENHTAFVTSKKYRIMSTLKLILLI